MKNCNEFQILIEKLITGNINKEEKAKLENHINSCNDCKDLYNTNFILSNSENPVEKAEVSDFNLMRKNVITKIKQKKENSLIEKFQQILETVSAIARKPEYAVAAITLIIGFFLGRALPPDENGITGGFLKQISNIAENNIYFSDTQQSSYRFSNVSMREIDKDKIQMSFDVSTNLEIVRKKTDPLVKEVLTQTMMNPDNVGSNLRAISYSENIIDNKIKQALIYSMHNAPLDAVRLKSMEGLMKYKMDPELQEAFVKVLLDESSIKMNLMAIDYLTENNYNPDSLKAIIEETNPQKSTAIFVRTKKNTKIKQ